MSSMECPICLEPMTHGIGPFQCGHGIQHKICIKCDNDMLNKANNEVRKVLNEGFIYGNEGFIYGTFTFNGLVLQVNYTELIRLVNRIRQDIQCPLCRAPRLPTDVSEYCHLVVEILDQFPNWIEHFRLLQYFPS